MNHESSFIEITHIPTESKYIQISGKFKINYQTDGVIVKAADVLKHILLVVTRTVNYQSVTPFKDIVVFDDDVIETDAGCSGNFNFNVFDKIAFNGSGDYYILCSLGTVTSNIIHVRFDECVPG